ncbi:MAG: Rho termination factor N-terminal domain-containing protein, partial [Arcobacteraceae bacterium]|nr:Rho termination factor N-terminal domain-containing protein [Arcobacteraceae bacterium]
MEENTQTKSTDAPVKKTKPQHKNNHNNQRKARTHIPVKGLTLDDLRAKTTEELIDVAKKLEVENPQELMRQDLIFAILSSQTSQGGYVLFTGILDIKDAGFGFLRAVDGNFRDSSNDSYVSAT